MTNLYSVVLGSENDIYFENFKFDTIDEARVNALFYKTGIFSSFDKSELEIGITAYSLDDVSIEYVEYL